MVRRPSALRKDASREIRKTMSRYVSLILLVLIAVAFLFGLRMSAPDMKASMDAYYDAQNLSDVNLTSTLGFSDNDVEAVRSHEGTAGAEGAWTVDALASAADGSGDEIVVKALSVGEEINVPYLVSGRMPETDTEILVEQKALDLLGLQIGDQITLDTGTRYYEGALKESTYTIVGTAQSPLYVSTSRGTSTLGSGAAQALVMLPASAFAMEEYTDLYIRVEGAAELDAYSSEYESLVDSYIASLGDLQTEREAARTEEVKSDAQQQVDDARQEYEDAKADAEQELADAAAELEDARAELDSGWAEYNDGLSQIEEAQKTLDEQSAQLAASEEELTQGEQSYADGLAAFNQSLADSGISSCEEARSLWQEALAAWQDQYDMVSGQLASAGMTRESYAQAVSDWEAADAALQATTVEDLVAQGYTQEEAEQALAAQRAALDAQKENLDAVGELVSALDALDSSKAQLDAQGRQLDALEAAQQQLEDTRAQLDAGWQQLEEGKSALAAAQAELDQSRATLEDSLQELQDGETSYADGLAEYEDAKADAEQELADAEQKIADAQEEVDSIETAEWTVEDASSNTGFDSFGADADKMENLAFLFPFFFFLVAALVCLTTMTRMVDEERAEIGTLKSLGYPARRIAGKYLRYGLSAALIGSAGGLVLGGTCIPWVVTVSYKVSYAYPGVVLTFDFPTAFFCVVAAVLCCVLAVVLAAFGEFRAQPAELMRRRAPKAGKKIWLEHIPVLWRRFTFSQKVAARNLFRYKRRFWMTTIGIAGCTALLLTGFGLYHSVATLTKLQYGELTNYSAVLYLDPDRTDEEDAKLIGTLDQADALSQYEVCTYDSVTMETSDYTLDGYLLSVADADGLDGYQILRERKDGTLLSLGDGAILSEKTADLLNVEVGGTVTVTDGDRTAEITVAGIAENYVGHCIWCTDSVYAEAFGAEPDRSEVLLRFSDETAGEELGGDLLDQDGVLGIYYLRETIELMDSSLDGVYPAVAIIILAAAALAFVVLFNLDTINITSRIRELATLKVLGFRDREVHRYVFRENIVLTCFGMVIGIVFGIFFHGYLITSVEEESAMFPRTAGIMSFVLSILLTAVFALIVQIVSAKRLDRIDMVDSLKANE